MEIKGWVNSGVGLQLNQPIVISTMSVIDVVQEFDINWNIIMLILYYKIYVESI